MLWGKVKALFSSQPSVSVQSILRRIEERQTTIDRTIKVGNDQLREVADEIKKRELEREREAQLRMLEKQANPWGIGRE